MEQPSAAAAAASASALALAVVESCRCRLCFSVEDLSCSLFPAQGNPSREVIDMILECTSIRITFEEDFPSKVCEKCLETLGKFYHYRQHCLKNDKILKSQRKDSSKLVKVKQEPLPVDEIDPNPEPLQQEEPAQVVKQEDPGGSSILRSILLQCREPGRTSSTGSGELDQDPTKLEDTTENQLPIETLEEELEVVPPQSSLLQQMLLHQGPNNHPNSSPSLLKRMLLEGGASDRQSPLEGSSTMNRRRSEDQKPAILTNHESCHQQQQQQHDENHNEEHSETPLASQLRAILLQHRAVAAAAAACSGMSSSSSTAASGPPSSAATVNNISNNSNAAEVPCNENANGADGNPPASSDAAALEKPEVSYLRSLFMRNDSDANEDSDSDNGDEPSNRELLFNMFQELRARNEINSDESDDSEDRAFDYRVPSVRRRSSESTVESRKRRRMTPTSDFTCLLCGRAFQTRSKLVLHMRTHLDPTTAGSPSTSAAASVDAMTANNVAAVHQSLLAAAAAAQSNNAAAAAAALIAGGSCSMSAAVAAAAAAAHLTTENNNVGGAAVDNQEDDEESRQIELLERRSYACYICGADQNNLQQLKEHLLLAHQDRIRSRGRAKERPKPLISCNFCNRQFRSQFAYGEHLRTHTGERPFPCDQCDKRFPRRFQLLGHLYNVHKQSWVADESKAKFVKK
ncbi:protein sister of odd and bowel-like [Uranotaenia lowii]|uniref:protein sister of odd and bowel-like n=1 Tax=Uranotaenia lowii TaxID=190385 RepID=UPI00247AB55A|nr:protein sister of odd and bowel-like [Uranotaenia lowii]